MKIGCLVILYLAIVSSLAAAYGQTTAFVGANLIPMDRERVVADQTIVVKNGFITAIGPSRSVKAPSGAERIDLKGAYVMPGLWDMHAHPGDDQVLDQMFRWGVTGARVPGALGEEKVGYLLAARRPANDLLPELQVAGYTHNGKACEVPEHRSVDSIVDLRAAIDFEVKNKLRFFKLHNCFPADMFGELMKLSRSNGIKVVGHIPEGVDPIEFVGYRPSSIEHLDIILRALSFRKNDPAKSIADAVKLLDSEYLDKLSLAMVKNNVALTPTLVTYENYINGLPEQQRGLGNALFTKLKKYNKRIFDHGVLLLAGTDTGLPSIEPGVSLHRELELMVLSGLTPFQALQTATTNPAHYLGNSRKPFSVGNKGTFLVLRKNPFDDIKNSSSISMVVKKGKMKIVGHDQTGQK